MESILQSLEKKTSSADGRVDAYHRLSQLLSAAWGGSDEEFLDNVPTLIGAIKQSLKAGRTEEKIAALLALRMVILSTNEDGFLPMVNMLDFLVREASGVQPLALEVLTLGLLLHRHLVDLQLVDGALAHCASTPASQRAFGALLMLKSNEDILDFVVPSAQWLVARFLRVTGSEQVEVGWSVCALFAALREERGEEGYDPYELDGFLEVDTFSDALRGVKALKPLERVFDQGTVPREELTFNVQKFAFEGFRNVMVIRFLRELLKKSFAVQMAENEHLFALLDYAVKAKPAKFRITQVEKRLTQSPNSASARTASKELKKNRQRKLLQQSFEDF